MVTFLLVATALRHLRRHVSGSWPCSRRSAAAALRTCGSASRSARRSSSGGAIVLAGDPLGADGTLASSPALYSRIPPSWDASAPELRPIFPLPCRFRAHISRFFLDDFWRVPASHGLGRGGARLAERARPCSSRQRGPAAHELRPLQVDTKLVRAARRYRRDAPQDVQARRAGPRLRSSAPAARSSARTSPGAWAGTPSPLDRPQVAREPRSPREPAAPGWNGSGSAPASASSSATTAPPSSPPTSRARASASDLMRLVVGVRCVVRAGASRGSTAGRASRRPAPRQSLC